MSGEEIVNKIVDGSAAIDEMRQKIDIVVKTIAGIFNVQNPLFLLEQDQKDQLLSPVEKVATIGVYPPNNPDGSYFIEWVIVVEKKCEDDRSMRFNWSIEAYPQSIPVSLVVPLYSTKIKDTYPLPYVKILYDGLPAFAKEMLKKFPFLETSNLKYLFEAADAKKKDQ